MKIVLVYGSGEENCKQSLVHLLLNHFKRYSLIEVAGARLYSSAVAEPKGSREGPYADSEALHLIRIRAPMGEFSECVEQGLCLAGDSDGVIITGAGHEDYPHAGFKIAVIGEGENREVSDADFVYCLREDFNDLVSKLDSFVRGG